MSKKLANYTLDNPAKITFEFLKSHLWSAADILRGSLDASEYRQPVMTLLFLKRLNDTFEENSEKLKNRWGSVTKKDTLNLNRNLMKAPNDIIDYIIIHELCHLKIQGHSHHFWSFLKQFVPDYQKKIDWLNRNQEFYARWYLLQFFPFPF